MENLVGSIEIGKKADFVLLDRDILTCPVNEIKDIKCRATYLEGRQVHPK